MSESEKTQQRARERSEIERRRSIVARHRWLEGNKTAAQIVECLREEQPPIVTTVRTVERDISAIRADSRRYLSVGRFDRQFEIATVLSRLELLAMTGTRRALATSGPVAARWARVAIHAMANKTALLQDVGLIDRQFGTLFVDDGSRPIEKIPSGEELQRLFESVIVEPHELVSEAEKAWLEGDYAAATNAAKDAKR